MDKPSKEDLSWYGDKDTIAYVRLKNPIYWFCQHDAKYAELMKKERKSQLST